MEQPRSILIELQRKPKGESSVNSDDWYVPMKINWREISLFLDTGAAVTWISASDVGLNIEERTTLVTQTHADRGWAQGYIHNNVPLQLTSANVRPGTFSLELRVPLVRRGDTSPSLEGYSGMLGLCGPAWQNSPSFLEQLVQKTRIPNKFALTLSTQDKSWIEFGGDLTIIFPKSEEKPSVEVDILTMKSLNRPEDRILKNDENAQVGDWVIEDIAYSWHQESVIHTMYPDNDSGKCERTEGNIRISYEKTEPERLPIMIDNGCNGLALPYDVANRVNMAMFGLTESPPDSRSDKSWCDHPVFKEEDLVDGKPRFKFGFTGFTLIIGGVCFPIPDESLVAKRNGEWESEIKSRDTNYCVLGDTFLKHVVAVHDLEHKKMIFRGK